jgi:lysophospholipase L1-like esterase
MRTRSGANRLRSLGLSILLATASALSTLAVMEVAARLAAFRGDEHALLTPAPPPRRGSEVRMGQILRPSSDRRIVYELFPDLSVIFLRVPLLTDGHGFRTHPRVRPTRCPRVRVVGLGDSVMFGWGVADADTYLTRIGETLEKTEPSVGWSVLNTAVPGYNTVMEVETLHEKALRPLPDLVILNFVGNDLGLPNFLLARRDYLSLDRSFLAEFVRSRLGGETGDLAPHLAFVPRDLRRWREGADADRIPAPYRGLVGMGPFERAMDELARLARQDGFEVVVLAHPEAPEFVRRAAAARTFLLVETGHRVQELARARGLSGAWEPPLSITAADPHPSPLGHALIAQALAEALGSAGLPERLVRRARSGPRPSFRP